MIVVIVLVVALVITLTLQKTLRVFFDFGFIKMNLLVGLLVGMLMYLSHGFLDFDIVMAVVGYSVTWSWSVFFSSVQAHSLTLQIFLIVLQTPSVDAEAQVGRYFYDAYLSRTSKLENAGVVSIDRSNQLVFLNRQNWFFRVDVILQRCFGL